MYFECKSFQRDVLILCVVRAANTQAACKNIHFWECKHEFNVVQNRTRVELQCKCMYSPYRKKKSYKAKLYNNIKKKKTITPLSHVCFCSSFYCTTSLRRTGISTIIRERSFELAHVSNIYIYIGLLTLFVSRVCIWVWVDTHKTPLYTLQRERAV